MVAMLLVMTLVAILTHGNPGYMSYVYLLIPFGLRFAGRKAKKYKPKTVPA
jgi:hypothetical protein